MALRLWSPGVDASFGAVRVHRIISLELFLSAGKLTARFQVKLPIGTLSGVVL